MSTPGVYHKKIYEVKAITGRESLAVGPFTETQMVVDMVKVNGLQDRFKEIFRTKMYQNDILNAESVMATSGFISNYEGWVWTFTIWAIDYNLREVAVNRYIRYLHECIAEAEIEFDLDLITEKDNYSETWGEMADE